MRKFMILVIVFIASAAWARDSARVLARILVEKGWITGAELARVESSDPAEGARLLAAMLYEKGLLTNAEMARIAGGSDARLVTASAQAPAAQPQALREAPAPAVTSQAKFPVSIYGTLLLNSSYNTGPTNIEDVPLFAGKQGQDPFGNRKNFGMTARGSRLGLRYQGPPIGGARLSGHFELDLFGGKAALFNGISMDLLRVRLAYGRLDWKNFSLLAGQDWSVFAPLNPTSLAGFPIPDLAASGNPWIRTPQLRAEFRHNLKDGTRLQWQAAATDPNVGDYPLEFRTQRAPLIGERGRMPGLDTRLGLVTRIGGREAALGLSSHYGRGTNVAVIAGRSVDRGVDSWGLALDYSLPLHSRVALSGEIFGGRALGIFSASLGQAVLPVGTPGEHGVETRGGWIQAQFNLAAKWQLNLAYGLDKPDAEELRTGDRSRNQTYMGNLLYRFSPHVTFGWEWRRFLTDFHNQRAANERTDHLNMAVAYTF